MQDRNEEFPILIDDAHRQEVFLFLSVVDDRIHPAIFMNLDSPRMIAGIALRAVPIDRGFLSMHFIAFDAGSATREKLKDASRS